MGTDRRINEFIVARDQMVNAIRALYPSSGKTGNLDILSDVHRHRVKLPDILCDRCPSYSQHGEDTIMLAMLMAHDRQPRGDRKPDILEVGANHPINMSNSWLFYKNGFRSVLVEPNPLYASQIKAIRPDDKLVEAGVAVTGEREATLYVPQHPEVASFSKEFVESFYSRRDMKAEVKELVVPLVSINEILQENFEPLGPLILNIDIEGMDFAVLKSLDWERWKPFIICLERERKPDAAAVVREFMGTKGYQLVAATPVNDIFRAIQANQTSACVI